MNQHIQKLADLFKEFPGIGERQAKRFVYFLLSKDEHYIREFVNAVEHIKNNITRCRLCFRYFEKNNSELCDICNNPKTDTSLLMVLEKETDLDAVMRSHTYKGRYFVFGNLIPIADTKTVERSRLHELKKRIQQEVQEGDLREVILAFSLNPQGEHTDSYVRQTLTDIVEVNKLKITSLGRGLSTGSELEYSDRETLTYALESRR